MATAQTNRIREWMVAVAALAAGVWFFASLGWLWPLPRAELATPSAELVERARTVLQRAGFDVASHEAGSSLRVDPVVDWIDESFGREELLRRIDDDAPVVVHVVEFKRADDPVTYRVDLTPGGVPVAFSQKLEEDTEGASLDAKTARSHAERVLRDVLGLELEAYRVRGTASVERSRRRDHEFGYERILSADPELREKVIAVVAGDVVRAAQRRLEIPAAAQRAERSAAAPGIALETAGVLALVAVVAAAFWIFLRELRDGGVRLGRAFLWPGVVLIGLTVTHALDTGRLFAAWDPLWPRAIAVFRFLVERSGLTIWILLVLLIAIGAGDALDRRAKRPRGESLWQCARGRIWEPAVGLASARGFLVGMLCGGAMVGSVWLLDVTIGVRTELQPRAFFFYTLNSASPVITSLTFFLGVALTEELGYRFFCGTWLDSWTRRRWIAILVPAVIYGLTHTRLEFLPPAEPWWGRAFVLASVGAVWGWAFFRYDALTVVLSHFTADLFIFNWPLLASSRSTTVAFAVVAVSLPLWPAIVTIVVRAFRRRGIG